MAEATAQSQTLNVNQAAQIDRSVIARWKHEELFNSGFVNVPTQFLELYTKLQPPLTSGEALFVIQLMSFKWGKAAPFPGYKRLGERMGLSTKALQRNAAALEHKNYLRRIVRKGSSNKFDLTPLFDALLSAHKKQEAAKAKLKEKE